MVAAGGAPAGLELAPVGGLDRMFRNGAGDVRLRVSGRCADADVLPVRLRAEDFFGRPVTLPGLPEQVELTAPDASHEIGITPPVGYFSITAEALVDGTAVRATTELGVVPGPHPGFRPDSFFSSNVGQPRAGRELELLRLLGIKVQRGHIQPREEPYLSPLPPEPTGAPLPLNFALKDQLWKESQAAEIWMLPVAGYAFPTARSDIATLTDMHGPPRDFDEFVRTYEVLLRHYPEITVWEFWNEPWIYSWTWAADGAAYRALQKQWCEMALRVNPDYRIVAGNSAPFVECHIEIDPACWRGLIHGTTQHPYTFSADAPTLRAGDQGRSVDQGALATRRMGLPYYYLTEGGTRYRQPPDDPEVNPYDPSVYNNDANANKVVQYFVHSALAGAYMGNAQWEIGYGPAWTRCNVAFGVMTRLLEDRPVVADLWPRHSLVAGAIFANPRFVTDAVRGLPRADELGARWDVSIPDERRGDATKVAVLWACTGPSAKQIDTDGTLTVAATGLRAYDVVGQEIAPVDGTLVLPFRDSPVYVTTDDLDVIELHTRLAQGAMHGLTPLNMHATSLLRPAAEPQQLTVRIENQLNRPVTGRLSLAIAGGPEAATTDVALPAGQLVDVPISWPGCATSTHNQYGVTLRAETDAGDVQTEQLLSVAQFVRRTVDVDGTLDGWDGVVPVLLDSDQVGIDLDLTAYLLNPNLELRPDADGSSQRILARVFTAYDDDNVYVAAAVHEDRLSCNAGRPYEVGLWETKVPTEHREGVVGGMGHITDCGDVFSFSFGFRDRVPGWGRQIGDPWAWKGHFYDTDDHFVAHTSTEGPQLVRQWGPDTPRTSLYEAEVPPPGVGPVPGGRIAISRDEETKVTVYEMAIPRTELPLFDPSAESCRFGFLVINDEQLGNRAFDFTSAKLGNSLEWSAACGVFDYWRSAGSFGPAHRYRLPCQTFFGID